MLEFVDVEAFKAAHPGMLVGEVLIGWPAKRAMACWGKARLRM
ncbi:hypothetical protein [Mesorhizobium sp. BR1-1-6]|nr:hypothetical protein [Mesorhizobium sp. BR1-1-6]